MAAERAYCGRDGGARIPVALRRRRLPARSTCVSDYFRSLRGSTLDMFRQPEKLLAMIDVMLPASIDLIIGACKATNTTRASVAAS